MDTLSTFWRTHYGRPRMNIVTAPYGDTVYSTVYVDSLLLPERSTLLTPPFTRFDRLNLDSNVDGTLFSHGFQLYVPAAAELAARVLVRFRWELLAKAPAGTTGRWIITATRSGTAISGANTAYTATRNVETPAVGTTYDELAVLDIPRTSFIAGQTFDVNLAFGIVAKVGGNTLGIGLHVDPTTPGSELAVEFLVGSP